jgi:membrane associated rhomboid family serine protease
LDTVARSQIERGFPSRGDLHVSRETRSCPTCGALNGSDFARCVRCGVSLSASALAARAAPLGRVIDGRAFLSTKTLAALSLVIFAAQVRAEMANGQDFVHALMNGDARVAFGFGAVLPHLDLVSVEPWRLLSAVFVHFGALHIALNLLALASFARMLEPAIGSARFAIAYVVTGVFGYATTLACTMLLHEVPDPTAGASSAVFGVMGVIVAMLWRNGDPRWKAFAVRGILFNIAIGFTLNSMHAGFLVNNSAHIGGLLCGIAFGLLYARPRRRSSDIPANLGALLAVAASVASLLAARVSPFR